MCAILGSISSSTINNYESFKLDLMRMSHRGPDYSSIWKSENNKVFLGHNRLSIIDLTSKAHQPMQDISNNLVIVFNGEIYNFLEIKNILVKKGHIFNSNSDTEVILNSYKEWGYSCLNKLNGAFAFSIFDKKKKIVFAARDRSGEKPFFYQIKNKTFKFSSELKGLFSQNFSSSKIDYLSLDSYLTFGFIPGQECILKGVKKLPPAHALIYNIDLNILKVWKYWELPKYFEERNINEQDLNKEFNKLFKDAVQKQMISDVPIGILLSGGLDSSLITYFASKISKNIKTFNVSFDGHNNYNESKYARQISNYLKTDHIEINAAQASPEIMFKLAKQFDEPIADSSMVPTYLLSKEVKNYCSVAIGGDGSDELFGGYRHYNRMLWCEKYLSWIPKYIKKQISSNSSKFLPTGFKGVNWLQSLNTDLNDDLPIIGKFFDKSLRQKLIGYTLDIEDAESIWKSRIPQNKDLIDRMTIMDFNNYLAEDILVKVDRSSMLNSLEIRAPFLDYRIIEFAFSKIPNYLKCTTTQRKIFLKKFGSRLLPKNFDLNRKQGFSIPLNSWIKSGKWRDMVHDVLLDKNCVFNKKIVEKIISNQDHGNNSERIFNLLIFEIWSKEYKITI